MRHSAHSIFPMKHILVADVTNNQLRPPRVAAAVRAADQGLGRRANGQVLLVRPLLLAVERDDGLFVYAGAHAPVGKDVVLLNPGK